jgi:hypothetical protein
MAPDLILVFAGLATVWSVFGIIGGERQRVVQNVEVRKRAREASAPAAKPQPKAAAAAAK